jgi:hypothetical protein
MKIDLNEPGPWWLKDHCPDGDCCFPCDACNKPIVIRVSWTPSFEAMTEEQADE